MEILKDCFEKKVYEKPELETETVTDILTESMEDSSDSMDGWGGWKI